MRIKKSEREPNWILLANFGLPISLAQNKKIRISIESVIKQLIKAAMFLDKNSNDNYGHYKDALRGLFIALKTHYPSFFDKISKYYACKKILTGNIKGKDIKLRNIALAKISKYI